MLRSVARSCFLGWLCVSSFAVAATTLAGAEDFVPEEERRERAARAASGETVPILIERDLSGPRFGITYRPDATDSEVGPVVSQFGWHFENQIVPVGGGPQFIIQFVPLIAGVEHGRFLPSGNLGMGVRFPAGFEFGLGPSVSVGRNAFGQERVRSSLFVAAGHSFDYGGVHLPVNVVFAGNRDGSRVSLIVGYAIHRASKAIEK